MKLGICVWYKYKTPIHLKKRAVRIIPGVHAMSPSELLFTTLKFLNCENILKYLIGKIMKSQVHFIVFLQK